jgi:predicted alpha/beta-hydrolase family hydrolase
MDAAGLLMDGPTSARHTLVLAHGAGAPMDSPFLEAFARGLVERGVRVVRFEFPYMERRRRGERSGGPDPQPVLVERWKAVLGRLGDPAGLAIGGKSLGGRIASMIADELRVRRLVCLGYPFHPPGRPDRPRTAHLLRLATPALIVQGTRDPFGTPEEVAGYGLPASIVLRWLEDGDHSFEPRKRSGRTLEQHMAEAVTIVAEFLGG